MSKNKLINIFGILRILLYLGLFITFLLIPTSYFLDKPASCYFRKNYNILCPCCGVTRCFSFLVHFDFVSAIKYNIIFALAIYPICLCIFIEDIINIVMRIIFKKSKFSLIERFIFNV